MISSSLSTPDISKSTSDISSSSGKSDDCGIVPPGVRSRSVLGLLLLLLLVSIGLGCERSDSKAGGVRRAGQLTDGVGRTVTIDAPPVRIVSLAPNITEILFAIGLDNEVVGVTSYCDYPATALTKEKVGDTITPNLEKIIALKPDLVIVTTASQLESLTRQLDKLAVPVYVTNPRTITDIVETIRQLGEVTGRQAEATELATGMESRITRIRNRVGRLPRVRTLYLLQVNPLISAGKKTFLNDLIDIAGGISISGGEETDYPQFSRETVLARAPEVILVPDHHGNGVPDEKTLRKVFAATPAIRNERIFRVNPDWVDRPGPRIVDGLEQFAQALHPESP